MTRSNADSQEPACVDDALITRLRAGDTVAFDEIVIAYYETLLRLAMSYLDSRESGEEVVQDILLNIWRQRADLVAPAGLRLYLFAATRNRAISQLRHRRVEQRLHDQVDVRAEALPFVPRQTETDARVRAAELEVAIRTAIDQLPTRCREAFVLSRQHHLTYEEIARVMGTSTKTVQEQMGRALKSLRRALADWLE